MVLLAWGATGRVRAQEEPEVIRLTPSENRAPNQIPRNDASRQALNVQEVLGELWVRRQAYLEKGDIASADHQVRLIRDVIREEGLLHAERIAGAFVVEGRQYLDAGSTQRALQAFNRAQEFAPERPEAFFAVARTLWEVDRNLWGAVTVVAQGLRVVLKNPAYRTALLGNLAMVVVVGSLLAAVGWCLLIAFKTARVVHHDLYEARARTLSEGAARMVAWGLWLLPVLLWLSGWWMLVYWLALGFTYQKASERLISLLACVGLLTALPVVGWITWQSGVATDPSIRFLLETARGSGDPERIPVLERMVAARPQETVYRFLLAQTYQKTGSPEAALEEYRRLQRDDPTEPRAWINSGNIFFHSGDYVRAGEDYRRATELAPDSAMGYFNLHLAYQRALRLEEADAAFRRARELDNHWVTSILASAGQEAQNLPAEGRYGDEEILRRLRWEPIEREGMSLTGPWLDPLSLAGGLGLVACLFLSGGGIRRRLGAARRCAKCGEPFCWRCQIGKGRDEGYCTPCRHLYVLKDPVPPRIRVEREQRVAAYGRWRWISFRLSSLLIPGAGQILGGRVFMGAGLLWMAGLSFSLLLVAGRLLASPQVSASLSMTGIRSLGIVLLGLTWLAGNLMSFGRAPGG